MCRAHFGDDAWPTNGRTRTDQWNCAPSSVFPRPLATLQSAARTGTGFLAAFRVVNGPRRRPPTPSRQLGVAPEGRSGVVARAGAVAKRRPVPIGGSACGGAHCSRLTRPSRARRTGFLFDVLYDGVPVEPSRGPIGTQWPPIPQCGEGRARLTLPRPLIIGVGLRWSSTTCGIPTFHFDAGHGDRVTASEGQTRRYHDTSMP